MCLLDAGCRAQHTTSPMLRICEFQWPRPCRARLQISNFTAMFRKRHGSHTRVCRFAKHVCLRHGTGPNGCCTRFCGTALTFTFPQPCNEQLPVRKGRSPIADCNGDDDDDYGDSIIQPLDAARSTGRFLHKSSTSQLLGPLRRSSSTAWFSLLLAFLT